MASSSCTIHMTFIRICSFFAHFLFSLHCFPREYYIYLISFMRFALCCVRLNTRIVNGVSCVVCRVSCMCAAIFKMNIRICSTLFFGFFACLVPSFFAFVQIILVLRQTFITFFTWQPNDTQQTVFKAIILLIFDNARRRIRREQKKIIRKSTTNRIITRGIKIIKKKSRDTSNGK